jgi:hypothetical protein
MSTSKAFSTGRRHCDPERTDGYQEPVGIRAAVTWTTPGRRPDDTRTTLDRWVAPADVSTLTARTTLRSWTRRFRRGRLEPLHVTAGRVQREVQRIAALWWAATVGPGTPVLIQDGIPVVYLVAHVDFWRMVQRTDLGPTASATLHVFVHRRTLADPWECTCALTGNTVASLSSEPHVFGSAESREAQVYARFWRELARRCELVLAGLD